MTPYYERALTLRRLVGDRNGEAATLNNIGRIHRLRGSTAQALALYQQALAILREIGDQANQATILSNVAMMQAEQGNWTEAESLLQQVLAIDEALGLPNREEDQAVLDWIRRNRQEAEKMHSSSHAISAAE